MIFRPRRSTGLAIGVAATAVLLAGCAFLINELFSTPVSLVSFYMGIGVVLLVLATLIAAFWTYSCFSLKYELKTDALVVTCGSEKHFIPLHEVKRLVPGEEFTRWTWQKGLRWPGYSAGYAKVENLGQALFYSAHRSSSELVYVVTSTTAYAVSPSDPAEFIAAVSKRENDEANITILHVTRHWPIVTFPFWQDRPAQMIVASALLLNALLFGYVLNFYPFLPELLPMHFTAAGEVDRIGFKSEVLRIPFIALFVLCANAGLSVLLHIRERVAAYLVLLTGLFVQVLFLVAIIKIVQA